MTFLIAVLIDLVIIFAVGKTAENKGRYPLPWMAMALFISFFAFLPLLAVGDTDEERARRRDEDRQTSPAAELGELDALRRDGVITAEEFEAKRATLLARI